MYVEGDYASGDYSTIIIPKGTTKGGITSTTGTISPSTVSLISLNPEIFLKVEELVNQCGIACKEADAESGALLKSQLLAIFTQSFKDTREACFQADEVLETALSKEIDLKLERLMKDMALFSDVLVDAMAFRDAELEKRMRLTMQEMIKKDRPMYRCKAFSKRVLSSVATLFWFIR